MIEHHGVSTKPYSRERELAENEIKIEVGGDSEEEVVDRLAEKLGLSRSQFYIVNHSYRVRSSLVARRQHTAKMILNRGSQQLLGALVKVGEEPKFTGFEPDFGYFESTPTHDFYGVVLVDREHNPVPRAEVEFRKMTLSRS